MQYDLYINGEWVKPRDGAYSDVLNPSDRTVLCQVAKGSREDVKKAIDSARHAFDKGQWREMTPGERSVLLYKFAGLIEANTEHLARLETMNQGKAIKLSTDSDLPFAVDNLRFFAGAARMLEGKASSSYAAKSISMLRREPMGVVAGIVPWNYPLMIAVWKFAPALAAGNTVIIKPASNTPATALELAKLAHQVGFPKGVFNVITGPGNIVGEELVSSAKVDMVSLTGDTATGKKIAQLGANTMKKMHLELGGKAPFIVFKDADVDAAVEGAIVGGFVNGGQDCTAATRIYVEKDIHDSFVRKLVKKARTIKVGDPLSRKTDMGPLVSESHLQRVEAYVKYGKAEGAKLALGGDKPKSNGFFHNPTIFTEAKSHMRICSEEIFGPVLGVYRFSSEEEVIHASNNVLYGLASSVWTKDVQKALRVAKALDFGTVWINDHLPLVSELPHGGFKQSGSGKDLSLYALEEYTRVKHVYADLSGERRKPWHYTVYGLQ